MPVPLKAFVLIAALAIASFTAIGQDDAPATLRYRWSIDASQQVFGKNPDEPRSNSVSSSTIETTIDRTKPGVVVLTITAIDLTIPGTHLGDLEFDSKEDAETESSDEDGDANPIAAQLREFIGEPLEFRYVPETESIAGPPKLAKMPGARMLGGILSEPFTTAALFAFFEDPTSDPKPNAYALTPLGLIGPVAEGKAALVLTEATPDEGEPTITGKFEGKATGIFRGQLGADGMTVTIEGDTKTTYATLPTDSFAVPMSHEAVSANETNFMYSPDLPVRSILKFKLAATLITD